MRYVEAGGTRLSAIGLGTWQFGSREWGYGSDYATTEAVAIAQRALDLGINLIDTAEMYAFGRSERIVGQAIAGRRDDAFVATKVFPVIPLSRWAEGRARRSARRMGVEVIDLYQVHWPNPLAPTLPVGGLRRLREQGLIRHAGVSNFSLRQWQRADEVLGAPVLSNQVQLSLVARRPERAILPWAQANDRIVIAYSPLAQGLLSGKYDAEHPPANAVRSGNALFLRENLARVAGLLAALRDVAARHDATSAQVALAWLLHRPNVVAIPGASSVSQLERNAAAADIELSDDDDHRLIEAADAFDPVHGPQAIPKLVAARFGR